MPLPFLVPVALFAEPTVSSLVAGAIIAVAGEGIRLWGVSIAGSETRTTGPVGGTQLVTTGPFAYVRNPLYLGNMIIYGGIGVMSMALFPWLTIAGVGFFAMQYALIVSLEEEHLKEKFGDEYRNYSGSVGRFLPRFVKYEGRKETQPPLEWKRGIVSEKSSLLAIVLVSALLVFIRWYRG